MSISGWKFSSNKIRISAKCKNIEYERAVRETLKGINAEKKEIYAAIKDYDTEVSKKYKFQIPYQIYIFLNASLRGPLRPPTANKD